MTLVELKNGEPRISSEIVSKSMELEHRFTTRMIQKYKPRFQDLGVLRFENAKRKTGRPMKVYWLNEEQTMFLCTLFRNSEIVLDFKQQLSKDFVAMKKAILEIKTRQQNASWIEARNSGKISRKEETDIIKEFVKYATCQGSKSAKMYYSNISRMENKALFIIEHKFKNIREALDGQQLATLSTCDQLVAKSIRDGIREGMHYKEIYKKAKADVLSLVGLIGTSYVPNQKQIESK